MNSFNTSIKDTSGQDMMVSKAPLWRRWRWPLISVIAVLLAVLWMLPRFAQVFSADQVLSRDGLRTSVVRRGDLQREIVAQGRIVAANSPTLFAPQQGFIDLRVKAGDSVEAGQVLAVTISPELNESLSQERSNLARVQVRFEREKIQSQRRRLELQQTEEIAGVNLKAMDREQRRAENAHAAQLISDLDYEQANDNLERAKLEFRQAQQNNALEQSALDFDVRTLKLEVETQQQLVDSLARRVDDLTILSPVSGMVGNVQVQQKQAVSLNQALITVVDLSEFEVEALVSEGYADEIAAAMKADISLNGEHYSGVVTAISPEVVASQVATRIRFADAMPESLRQNQRLTARIVLESKPDVLMVDRGSLVDGFAGYAFKLEGDHAERVPVSIGSTSLRHVEITAGLEEGEEIIISAIPDQANTHNILIGD